MPLPARKYTVVVRSQFAALHHCPPNLVNKSNKFIASPHRHLFKVELGVRVHSEAREVEFFDLLTDLNAVLQRYEGEDLETMSCEAICSEICEAMSGEFNYGVAYVSVFEDGENGSRLDISYN